MKNSAYLILLITIASLLPYLLNVAESRNEHQDYLEADPDSYCELRGAGGDSPAEKETKSRDLCRPDKWHPPIP